MFYSVQNFHLLSTDLKDARKINSADVHTQSAAPLDTSPLAQAARCQGCHQFNKQVTQCQLTKRSGTIVSMSWNIS
jgi:hypothetical protein